MEKEQATQVTWGLAVVLIGLILLGGELDFPWDIGRLWPLIFLVLGVGHLLNPDYRRQGVWFPGGWWFFLGGLFLLHNFHILRLRDSWPLFVVFGGLAIMFSRKAEPPATPPGGGGAEIPGRVS